MFLFCLLGGGYPNLKGPLKLGWFFRERGPPILRYDMPILTLEHALTNAQALTNPTNRTEIRIHILCQDRLISDGLRRIAIVILHHVFGMLSPARPGSAWETTQMTFLRGSSQQILSFEGSMGYPLFPNDLRDQGSINYQPC